MSKILKNVTLSSIFVTDTGVSIPASSQYTIPPQDYLLWAASSDIVTYIGNSDIVVNDGSYDLSISDGVDLIKGIYPTTVNVNQAGTTTYEYGSVSSVSSGVLTTIASKLTLVSTKVMRIVFSGTNIAEYTVLVGSNVVAKQRTMFGSDLSGSIDLSPGLLVASGQTIYVKVLHQRSSSGDFEATILYNTGF